MDYREAIAYLLSLSDMERGVQLSANPAMSLDSMRSLLARLGDPQIGRHTIHVTGSKGKGSTATMVSGILGQAGLRTGLYTSPHLHSFTERITIDGEAVGFEEFAAGIDALRPAIEAERLSARGDVSTFGVLTALFFWLMRAQIPPVDWQVVEVGLGGTFDATNVLRATDVAVITPVSLEHTAILGRTPAEIARDKAGIIKPGSVCVLARQRDSSVREVVRNRCEEVGAALVAVEDAYRIVMVERHVYGQAFVVEGQGRARELRSPMLGRHQAENAATAIAVADVLRGLGHDISESAIASGIARARLAGRLEVMGQRPLIVADGAHNGESAGALAQALRDYFQWRRCYLVIGCTRDKDLRSIGLKLARLAEMIVCCRFRNPRSMDPYEMIREIGVLGPMAVAEESVADGLETALTHADSDDLICVTGSLYVVAEAREKLLGESVTRA